MEIKNEKYHSSLNTVNFRCLLMEVRKPALSEYVHKLAATKQGHLPSYFVLKEYSKEHKL